MQIPDILSCNRFYYAEYVKNSTQRKCYVIRTVKSKTIRGLMGFHTSRNNRLALVCKI